MMPRPYDWKFKIEIPYDNEDEEAASRANMIVNRRQVGIMERIGEFFNNLWSAFKWALTLGGNIAETGDE